MKHPLFIALLLCSTIATAQKAGPNGQFLTTATHPTNTAAQKINDGALLECYFDSTRYLTEINDPFYADAYPWLSPDGLRMYFTDENGFNQLSLTKRNNLQSPFQPPVYVPLPDSANSLTSCWLSENELDAYFCSAGQLNYCHRESVNNNFTSSTPIKLLGITPGFISGASLNEAQTELFLYHYINDFGHIAQFTKTSDYTFLFLRYLTLPNGYYANPAQLSKDDLSIFLSQEDADLNRTLARFTRPTTNDTFALESLEVFTEISEPLFYNGMPSVSADGRWMAFVRAFTDSWSADEILITQCDGNLVPVFAPETDQWSLSPNPAEDVVIISGPFVEELRAEIISAGGATMRSRTLVAGATIREMSLENLPAGLYFLKLYSGNRALGVKKLVRN